jgi:uncharacterized iron-regulated membrane protein
LYCCCEKSKTSITGGASQAEEAGISRAQWLKLHRWVGGVLAVFLLSQGLTGAALVFRDEIEPLIHSELTVAPGPQRVSAQAMLDTVRAAHPEATVSRAEFPESPDQAVLFKLKTRQGGDQILLAVDPYRGTIVRDGGLSAWPTEWIFVLHEQLFLGPMGETVIGIEGLCLLFLGISGLVYWWPAKGRFRQGFRVKLDGSADVRWRTLHRAVGAGVSAVLILLAVTGALLVWKEPFRDALGTVTAVERKPTPKVAEVPGRAMLPVDTLVASAQAAQGGAALQQLRFSSGERVVAVYLDGTHTVRPDGTSQIYYNAYDGRELGRYVAGELSGATEFIDWIYTVHIGLWGGVPTKLVMLIEGLLLAGLGLTGPWLWWSRAARRRRAQAARGATPAAQTR